jgi:uncharacterized protein (TIGR03067 family)
MPRPALLLSLLALTALAFAPAPFPKSKQQARPAALTMEGLWRRSARGPERGGSTVRITATTWTNYPERGGPPDFDVKADPRASPAAFDLSDPGASSLYLRGIYKVEGDTLTICFNPAIQGRPTAFDGPGKGRGTEVFTRVR